MVAFDPIVADHDGPATVGDQLPLEMGTDVLGAPAEDVYPRSWAW